MKNNNWFGSDERAKSVEAIRKLSTLRRLYNCLSRPRTWKLARAYSKVAVDALHRGDDKLFEVAVEYGDVLWNEVHRQNKS